MTDGERAQGAASALPQSRREIPYGWARTHGLVPVGPVDAPELALAMREGADAAAVMEARRHLGRSFDLAPVSGEEFARLLADHYAGQASAAMAGEMARGAGELDWLALDMPNAQDLLDSADDAPAIRLINSLLAQAARQGASDVHVEPYDSALVVRMRLDGVLREVLRLPPHVAPVLVSRIKVMARLDIAERRLPQDGRIGLTLGGRQIDVRVSSLPSRAGERVVLRLLDQANAALDLAALGMDARAESVFRAALGQPNGIILVTGPTGSGKTTSLYAGLAALNDGQRNILTIEDPVEYALEGVGQTQVNAKVGLSFAAGLRAILRQDPDIVMVGEIRDRETADIAVQASLTGHLVLSTVHTNDAAGAITRLRDMKVEPFLLASSLRAVIAQRLVRRLCPNCRREEQADGATAALLGVNIGTRLFAPGGCGECGQTGYKGRVGLFECLAIDEPVRAMIHDGADEAAIAAQGFAHAPRLADEARRLVLAGETSVAEAVRVFRPEGGEGDA